jgi:lipoate-protein ligase A
MYRAEDRLAGEIAPYDRDDDLIEAVRQGGGGRLRIVAGPEPMVVLGRGSKPEREVRLAACLADGVLLRRRRGGGCSVVLDPGNVIVSLALPAAGFGNSGRYLGGASRWLIDGLARAGLPGVEQRGICDLARGERKVGGACLYRSRGLVYYTTTLLVEPRLDLITRYLRHPPREPDYRGGRAHADFLGSLGTSAVGLSQLVARLRQVLRPCDAGTLIDADRR